MENNYTATNEIKMSNEFAAPDGQQRPAGELVVPADSASLRRPERRGSATRGGTQRQDGAARSAQLRGGTNGC